MYAAPRRVPPSREPPNTRRRPEPRASEHASSPHKKTRTNPTTRWQPRPHTPHTRGSEAARAFTESAVRGRKRSLTSECSLGASEGRNRSISSESHSLTHSGESEASCCCSWGGSGCLPDWQWSRVDTGGDVPLPCRRVYRACVRVCVHRCTCVQGVCVHKLHDWRVLIEQKRCCPRRYKRES